MSTIRTSWITKTNNCLIVLTVLSTQHLLVELEHVIKYFPFKLKSKLDKQLFIFIFKVVTVSVSLALYLPFEHYVSSSYQVNSEKSICLTVQIRSRHWINKKNNDIFPAFVIQKKKTPITHANFKSFLSFLFQIVNKYVGNYESFHVGLRDKFQKFELQETDPDCS